MSAPDFGKDQESLRRLPEQQHRGVRRPSLVQQVQMLQQLARGSLLRERELPGTACSAGELRHPLEVEIVQRRLGTRGRVEGSPANQLPGFQILDQRRVESGNQLCRRVEPLPDQARLSLAYQRSHLRMAGVCDRSLHEDQAVRSDGSRAVELTFRRRYSFVVLVSVVPAEQPQVDFAPFNFVKVKLVRPPIRGRRVLEQEDFEKPPHQNVVPDIVPQNRPLFGELTLDAADEDTNGCQFKSVRCFKPGKRDGVLY